MEIYRLPLGQWVNVGVDWLLKNYGHTFDLFSSSIKSIIDQFKMGLTVLPWWLILIVFIVLAWKANGWRLALGTGLGLSLIFDLSLWPAFLDTLVLVIFSALVSIFIGVPLGILAARSNNFHRIFTPLLDFMQTMPSFVYLIPALMFFGLGTVPAIFATVIFAMPPVTRLTDLGIRQVPAELIEVGEAFGSTPRQMLWKIQLPVALPTIMAGINQTLMLSLSMVVISAMIGAEGFGAGVLQGISQMDIGKGFENGLAVVILAMVLDRMSQGIIKRGTAGARKRRPRSLPKGNVD
ncbi:glycine betaine transport system permease protein OpuAB [Peptococcaceae bacterium CEB3]|nr:glycine betaine transport system permease protein OpuAB [Peptococcaceae bacterium CEB3]